MTHLKPMPIIAPRRAETRQDGSALAVLRAAQRAGELVHLEHIPGHQGQSTSWPEAVRPEVAAALAARGIVSPWTHQAQAAGLALTGSHVIIATRAASGKSAGYLAAALSEVLGGGTVLYIAPTKALGGDQLKAGRGPTQSGQRPRRSRRPRHLLRRRLDDRRARLGPGARQLPADKSRHDS